MSAPTPRTDAEMRRPQNDTGMHNNLEEFTRGLERELAEANARLQNIPVLLENNAKLRRELAEAKAELKMWKQVEAFQGMADVPLYTELAKVRAELTRMQQENK